MKNLTNLGVVCFLCSLFLLPGNAFSQNDYKTISSWLLTKNNVMADGNMAVFAAQYSNAIDQWDARKMPNPGENFGISRHGYTLAVEARQPVASDTLFFYFSNLREDVYKLKFLHNNMKNELLICTLYDQYTGTNTFVDLQDTTDLEFSVDANPGSKASNRMMLIYRPLYWAVLPVHILDFQASRSGNQAQIRWSVNNEKDLANYTLEMSRNGRDFSAIAKIEAKNELSGNAQYAHPYTLNQSGKYFFRLRHTDFNAQMQYSKIIALQYEAALDAVRVVPNPASGSSIGIEWRQSNEAKSYVWQIHSPQGKLIQTGQLRIPAQAHRVSIQPSSPIASGTYFLTLSQDEEQKTVLLRIQ